MAEYYFNFPPEDQLTLPQRAASHYIGPIALSGGPGTGKSFVSLWRHIINHTKVGKERVRSQLLTYTTTLAYYLKATVYDKNAIAAEYVNSTQNWYYNLARICDELIIDEAQDMPLDFYKNPNKLRRLSTRISYGADNKQILSVNAINKDGTYNLEKCSPEEDLMKVFGNEKFVLDKNFRNTKKILRLAKTAFKSAVISEDEINSCKQKGELPSLIVTKADIDRQTLAIKMLLRTYNEDGHNIGILLPLAKIPWKDGEPITARYYYELLKNDFDVSFYDNTEHKGHGLNEMKNIHITTYKSAKGLEFDTVIMPAFNNYNLYVVSWRDYFVAITRAKSNLFLFSEKELPKLMSVADIVDLSQMDLAHEKEIEKQVTEVKDDLPF
jgi:superfamily I DNA/RNA helicase